MNIQMSHDARVMARARLAAMVEEFYNQCNSDEDGRFCEGKDGPGRKRDPGTEDIGKKGLVQKTAAKKAPAKKKAASSTMDKKPAAAAKKPAAKKADAPEKKELTETEAEKRLEGVSSKDMAKVNQSYRRSHGKSPDTAKEIIEYMDRNPQLVESAPKAEKKEAPAPKKAAAPAMVKDKPEPAVKAVKEKAEEAKKAPEVEDLKPKEIEGDVGYKDFESDKYGGVYGFEVKHPKGFLEIVQESAIGQNSDEQAYRIEQSMVDKDTQGKGLGTYLYLKGAEEVAAKGGYLMSDTGDEISGPAKATWAKLKRLGYPVEEVETPEGTRYKLDLRDEATKKKAAAAVEAADAKYAEENAWLKEELESGDMTMDDYKDNLKGGIEIARRDGDPGLASYLERQLAEAEGGTMEKAEKAEKRAAEEKPAKKGVTKAAAEKQVAAMDGIEFDAANESYYKKYGAPPASDQDLVNHLEETGGIEQAIDDMMADKRAAADKKAAEAPKTEGPEGELKNPLTSAQRASLEEDFEEMKRELAAGEMSKEEYDASMEDRQRYARMGDNPADGREQFWAEKAKEKVEVGKLPDPPALDPLPDPGEWREDHKANGRLLEKMSKESLATMAKEDRDSLEAYTRHGDEKAHDCIRNSSCGGDAEKLVERIDAALEKAPVLDTPLTTYRGIQIEGATPDEVAKWAEGEFKPGAEVQLARGGYQSTSVDVSTAHGFAKGEADLDSSNDGHGVVFEIKAVKGIALGEGISKESHESEFLIGRNETFRVVGVFQTMVRGENTTVVQVEQIIKPKEKK